MSLEFSIADKACGIYGAIHRDSGRVYVGSSVNIGKRWKEHRSAIKRPTSPKFHNALRKYGFEAFDFEVLEECAHGDFQQRERFYIQFVDSVANGFNLEAIPGKPHLGRNHSEIHKERIRAAATGKKHSYESKERMSAAQSCLWTAEKRRKLSSARKGVKPSEATYAALSKAKSKPVMQIDKNTGMEIQRFDSGVAAGLFLGMECSGIYHVCKGKLATSGGYKWRFCG